MIKIKNEKMRNDIIFTCQIQFIQFFPSLNFHEKWLYRIKQKEMYNPVTSLMLSDGASSKETFSFVLSVLSAKRKYEKFKWVKYRKIILNMEAIYYVNAIMWECDESYGILYFSLEFFFLNILVEGRWSTWPF